MADNIILLPVISRRPLPSDAGTDFAITSTSSASVALRAEALNDPEIVRASILRVHIRTVLEWCEHLGSAAAVELCRAGLEVAERARTKECGP